MLDIQKIREGYDLIDKGMKVLAGGPLDYYLRRLTDCYELLINRYAPFKIGDRVMLSKTPVIDSETAWGWMGSKHFLIRGAAGTIQSVEANKDGFRFGVVFDDDSFIDSRGVKQPIIEKGTFTFSEDFLVGIK